RPRRHRTDDLFRDSIERAVRMTDEQFGDTLISEFLGVLVGGLGDAVRKRNQQITGLQSQRLLLVLNSGKESDRKSFATQALNLTAANQHRREMSGVCVDQLAALIAI